MAIKINGTTVINNDKNIENIGVVSATTFVGDGSQLTGVGVGTEDSINTTGIITASTISANEFIGTGDKLIFSPSPTAFSPIDGATDITLSPTISITFDQLIYTGVGSIFLRNSSGIGTVIESIGIGSTLISGQTLTFAPSSPLPIDTDVYVVLPQGVVKNSVGGNNALLDTYNFTTVDFSFLSINPTNGATNVGVDTNVTLTFTSPPTKGTGTITLRSGSASGSILESFDAASSGNISISGNDWILNPTSDLPFDSSIYLVIPNGAIQDYVGLNTTGADSHNFTTVPPSLGDAYEGGYLICQSGGTRWIVAPSGSEVARDWNNRIDSVTTAQSVSGCTGWFVPERGQLQNPGYQCRIHWDSYTAATYWSNSQYDQHGAWVVSLVDGSFSLVNKGDSGRRIRAFRCVSY